MKLGAAAGWTVLCLFAALVALFMWVRWQERSAVFIPSRDLAITPSDLGLAFEEMRIASGTSVLHGWYIPGPGDKVVLWLHGNAGNISDRVHQAAAMHRMLGASSFLFDYRGYGLSTGSPSERGLQEDAEAAFRFLAFQRRVPPRDIILYGHSLGSAPALSLALGAGKEAGGLVLESAFTSARDMARLIYPYLPVGLLMTLKLDNLGRIGELAIPLLAIHGQRDATIPFQMGLRLYEAAPEPKQFVALPGADHSDGYLEGGEAYWTGWKDLLEGRLAKGRAVTGSRER